MYKLLFVIGIIFLGVMMTTEIEHKTDCVGPVSNNGQQTDHWAIMGKSVELAGRTPTLISTHPRAEIAVVLSVTEESLRRQSLHRTELVLN